MNSATSTTCTRVISRTPSFRSPRHLPRLAWVRRRRSSPWSCPHSAFGLRRRISSLLHSQTRRHTLSTTRGTTRTTRLRRS
eukprot:27880_1